MKRLFGFLLALFFFGCTVQPTGPVEPIATESDWVCTTVTVDTSTKTATARRAVGLKNNWWPTGSFSFEGLLRRVIERKITVTEAGEKREMTMQEAMLMKLAQDALNADNAIDRHRAMNIIMDRTEGRPVQINKLTDGDGAALIPFGAITVNIVGANDRPIVNEDDLPGDDDEELFK